MSLWKNYRLVAVQNAAYGAVALAILCLEYSALQPPPSPDRAAHAPTFQMLQWLTLLVAAGAVPMYFLLYAALTLFSIVGERDCAEKAPRFLLIWHDVNLGLLLVLFGLLLASIGAMAQRYHDAIGLVPMHAAWVALPATMAIASAAMYFEAYYKFSR